MTQITRFFLSVAVPWFCILQCNEHLYIHCIYLFFPFSLEVNQLIIYTNNFIFHRAQTNRQISSIHCQILILSILNVHVGLYVSIRNYNMAQKKFPGMPPPLYSACEIKLLQYHNKIRLIVFVPAQISTDDLSIDNLKFFHCPFTKCMPKVFLNDWQNYVKVKHNLILLFYLNIFYYASPNFLLDSPTIYI